MPVAEPFVRFLQVVPTTGKILGRNEAMANYYYRLEELLDDNDIKVRHAMMQLVAMGGFNIKQGSYTTA